MESLNPPARRLSRTANSVVTTVSGSPSLADWLQGWGALAAVVAALCIALGPLVARWWRRPRIAFVAGEAEPFIRPYRTKRDGLTPDSYLVRLGVQNTGRAAAVAVRARLLRWWVLEPGGRWVALSPDPFALQWTWQRGDVDLLPGQADLLEVAAYAPGGSNPIRLAFPHQVEPGTERAYHRDRHEAVECRAQVAVGGSNVAPGVVCLAWKIPTSDELVGRAWISSPPDGADDVGWLQLWGYGKGDPPLVHRRTHR